MAQKAKKSSAPVAEKHHLAPPRQTMAKVRRFGFALLFVCLISTGMGQSLFFALLPPVARDMGLTEIQVSTIFTLSAILWMLLSPYWGRKSDIWGRKPIVLVGIIGFGVSTAGFGMLMMLGLQGAIPLTTLYILMIFVRAIFGTFGSGAPSAAQAYVADFTTRKERTQGVATLGAAFGMGTVVGPGFAAALATVHFIAPFLALGSISLFCAIAIWIVLPERRASHRPKVSKKSMPRLKISDARVFPFLIMGTVTSLAQAAVIQVAAFYALDVMLHSATSTAQLVGIGMMSMAMATLFAQLVIVPRLHPTARQLLLWGAGIIAFSSALRLLPPSDGLFVVAFTLEGLGAGLLRPGIAAGASLSVKNKEQGAAAGLVNSTAASGIILVPILVMPLYLYEPTAPFALSAVLMLGIFVYSLFPRFVNLERDIDLQAHEEQTLHPQHRPTKL